MEITPEKETYCVGDTLIAEFTITNLGDVPITLDKLLLGGRFNGDKLPDGEYPDFTFQSVTLQPDVLYQYTGTLELTHPGDYQFFIAYYIENPTPEEEALLDENNWNTCIDLGEGLSDEDRTEEIYTAPGYAIIVAGQADWRQKSAIDHSANNAYRALRNLGFDDDHIFYLNSNQPQDIDGDGESEVDALALLTPFENAINQVKAEIGDSPTPLVFYLTGHGLSDPDCFIFDEGNPSEGYLWVAKFKEELDKFSTDTPMLIVLGSCYSGVFVTSDDGISAPNRIIITATHDDDPHAPRDAPTIDGVHDRDHCRKPETENPQEPVVFVQIGQHRLVYHRSLLVRSRTPRTPARLDRAAGRGMYLYPAHAPGLAAARRRPH